MRKIFAWPLAQGPRFWLTLLAALLLLHFAFVAHYAVNLPFYDEWEFFRPQRFPIFSPSWFFSFHNEHRIVLTRVLVWLDSRLFHWDFRYLIVFNFLLYALLVQQTWKLLARDAEDRRRLAPFFVFFASTLAWENLFWGFQSQIHGVFLFWILALRALQGFEARPWRASILAALLLVISIFSFASGPVLAVATVGGLGLFEIRRRRHLGPLLFFALTMGVAIFFWSRGLDRALEHGRPETARSPLSLVYFFSLLMGSVLGFDDRSGVAEILGALFFLLTLGVWARILRKNTSPGFAQGQGAPWTLFLGLVLNAVIVTWARVPWGMAMAKVPRYGEAALLMLPLWAGARLQWRGRSLQSLLWWLCFCGFLNNWSFWHLYRTRSEHRQAQAQCLRASPERFCPELYPQPLGEALTRAHELKASFAQDLPFR